jgi:hypothetical protein
MEGIYASRCSLITVNSKAKNAQPSFNYSCTWSLQSLRPLNSIKIFACRFYRDSFIFVVRIADYLNNKIVKNLYILLKLYDSDEFSYAPIDI